jgi:NitT/TauT family transport system substrate-binding protein
VDLSHEDAGNAFLMREVDAAVTWEPWLTQGRQSEHAAVRYVEADSDEANEIMARNVGGWLEDPAVFAETLKGVRYYDAARNWEYFGLPDRPGQIYQTSQYAIDF